MYCQACHEAGPTRYVELYQNVGMLLTRVTKILKGHLCRKCISKYFWRMTLITFVAGWWSIVSIVVTPFLLANNIRRFVNSRDLPLETPHPLGGTLEARLKRLRGED